MVLRTNTYPRSTEGRPVFQHGYAGPEGYCPFLQNGLLPMVPTNGTFGKAGSAYPFGKNIKKIK
jgi:hypothetical protein